MLLHFKRGWIQWSVFTSTRSSTFRIYVATNICLLIYYIMASKMEETHQVTSVGWYSSELVQIGSAIVAIWGIIGLHAAVVPDGDLLPAFTVRAVDVCHVAVAQSFWKAQWKGAPCFKRHKHQIQRSNRSDSETKSKSEKCLEKIH